jgi:hypothetical protein
VERALALLNRAQQEGGGDPFIGQKLEALLRAAGFSRVEVKSVEIDGHPGDMETLRSSAEELAEIFESLDEAVSKEDVPLLLEAARDARALAHTPGAEFHFRPVVALGTR